jgi:hypothetical protein
MSRDNTAPATPLPPAPVVVVPGNRRPNPRAAARPQPASREAQRLAAAAIRSAPVMEDNTPNSSGAIPAEVLQRTPAEAGAAGIAPATAPAPDA